MGSIRLPEFVAKLVKTSNTMLSFPASLVNIGALQYKNVTALTLNTGTIGVGGVDAALTVSSTYYVYAVVSNGVLAIIGSKNSSLPAGFTLAKQIGIFNTDASNLIGYPDVSVSTSIPGQMICFGGATPPVGWLLCDGAAVNRITYSALFQAIGTAWGYGDNSTTFNLPDLRGRYLRGRNTSGSEVNEPAADVTARTACNTGGNTGGNVGSVQGSNYASHGHGLPFIGRITDDGSVTSQALNYMRMVGGATGYSSVDFNTSSGNAGGNETRGTNAYANYIIKY